MSVEAITEVIHECEKLFDPPETEEEKRVRHVKKGKLFFLLSAPFSTVSMLQFLEQNEVSPNFPSLLRKIFGRKPFFRHVFLQNDHFNGKVKIFSIISMESQLLASNVLITQSQHLQLFSFCHLYPFLIEESARRKNLKSSILGVLVVLLWVLFLFPLVISSKPEPTYHNELYDSFQQLFKCVY